MKLLRIMGSIAILSMVVGFISAIAGFLVLTEILAAVAVLDFLIFVLFSLWVV